MKLLIAFVACTISQGEKGTYETTLLTKSYDAKYFYTSAHGPQREEGQTVQSLQYTKIKRHDCRVLAVLKHGKDKK